MEKDSLKNIFLKTNKILREEDLKTLSPLSLAYVGDAVFELLVRTHLLTKDKNSNKLHREAAKIVSAKSQANLVLSIMDDLSSEEESVVRRGRNAKSHTVPKNALLRDYKYATGLEALFGYLYLRGRDERIEELFNKIKEIIKNESSVDKLHS